MTHRIATVITSFALALFGAADVTAATLTLVYSKVTAGASSSEGGSSSYVSGLAADTSTAASAASGSVRSGILRARAATPLSGLRGAAASAAVSMEMTWRYEGESDLILNGSNAGMSFSPSVFFSGRSKEAAPGTRLSSRSSATMQADFFVQVGRSIETVSTLGTWSTQNGEAPLTNFRASLSSGMDETRNTVDDTSGYFTYEIGGGTVVSDGGTIIINASFRVNAQTDYSPLCDECRGFSRASADGGNSAYLNWTIPEDVEVIVPGGETVSWIGPANIAPIPLPAGAWLLLSGLAGLGALRRLRG